MVNVITTQRHRYYIGVPMNESIIANVATIQRRKYYANILMSESIMVNVTTTQRRRCCSFDSPGLASNEPTLGYQKQKAMGFVNLQTSYAPLLLLKEMKLKKRNTVDIMPAFP